MILFIYTQIKKNFLFSDNIWLKAEDVSNNIWLEKFHRISNGGLMVMDSDLEERVTKQDECLGGIYKNNEDDMIPYFSLTSWDCSERKSVVCRKEPSKGLSSSKPKQFPCIPQTKTPRKKREDGIESTSPLESGTMCIH